MAWASGRCKPQARRTAPPLSALASLRSAPLRHASQFTEGAYGPPLTPPLSSVDWWADVHHQSRAARRIAAPRAASLTTEALGNWGRPHHLLQAHEPSGCHHRRDAPPRAATRRIATLRQPPRGSREGAPPQPSTQPPGCLVGCSRHRCYATRRLSTRRDALRRAAPHRPPLRRGHNPPLSSRLSGGLIAHHLRTATLPTAPLRTAPGPRKGPTSLRDVTPARHPTSRALTVGSRGTTPAP